jgi:hypothetical protein
VFPCCDCASDGAAEQEPTTRYDKKNTEHSSERQQLEGRRSKDYPARILEVASNAIRAKGRAEEEPVAQMTDVNRQL